MVFSVSAAVILAPWDGQLLGIPLAERCFSALVVSFHLLGHYCVISAGLYVPPADPVVPDHVVVAVVGDADVDFVGNDADFSAGRLEALFDAGLELPPLLLVILRQIVLLEIT